MFKQEILKMQKQKQKNDYHLKDGIISTKPKAKTWLSYEEKQLLYEIRKIRKEAKTQTL